MDGVYLTIENRTSLLRVINGALQNGYLRNMDLRKLGAWINRAELPIRIPVNLDSVIGNGQNPIVKGLFGRNIDATITKYVTMAMRG